MRRKTRKLNHRQRAKVWRIMKQLIVAESEY
jgi:hypothetical protein